jgi:hypothetical protein
MASIEQLIFDIVAKDHASEGLSKAGMAARDAAGNVDTLQKRLDEVGRKSAQARVSLAGNKEAQAALDKIDARLVSLDRRTASPNLKVEGAARAIAEISAVDVELDKIGRKGGAAAQAESALSGVAGTLGAGAATGMGALIAAGVVLSPVLATLGTGLGGLGLAAYGAAKPIEDASKKTGGLAANMKLLDPEQRAVAQGILGLGKEYGQFQQALKPEVLGAFNGGLQLAGHLLRDIEPVAAATGKSVDVLLGRVDAEFQSGQWRSFFTWMGQQAGPDVKLVGDNLIALMNDLPPLIQDLQPVASGFLKVTDAILSLPGAIGKADAAIKQKTGAGQQGFWGGTGLDRLTEGLNWLEKHLPAGNKSISDLLGLTGGATKSVAAMGGAAKVSAVHVQTLAQQVNSLTNAENKALSPLLAYTNALITQKNDAASLNNALKQSHDRIGLNTAAQRQSFSAANTYIQDLLNTSAAAVKSHQGIDAQIRSIQGALPELRSVKGGTKEYWQEVQSLVKWLQTLQRQKQIYETVFISGKGTWRVGTGNLAAAGGAYIGVGTTPTADDVIARVSKGELIVPARMVSAGAVDHLRGQIPGFAAGGYAGALKGLQPWAQASYAASLKSITGSIAGALAHQVAAMFATGSGALGGDAAANRALARQMFPWPAGMWAAFDYLEMREAGYNRFARNPSSGAYGIPQALPESKLPFAGQSGGGSHAGPQLSWMFGYIGGRYGNPVNAAAHERAFNWYGGGLDTVVSSPTLIGVGERGAERVTVTPAGRGGGNTYIINVNVAPGASLPEAGRQMVNAILAHEKRSGKGWRS